MGELSTRAEAVKALGLRGTKALDRLMEKGAPRPRPGKRGTARYDVEAIRKWQEERKARVAPTLDLQAERARLAQVQRRHINLKIRQMRGELIPRAAVALLDGARQATVRSAILRLPTDAIQRGIPREYEALLRDLTEGVLTSLAAAKWSEARA